jgi:hypothetical protein
MTSLYTFSTGLRGMTTCQPIQTNSLTPPTSSTGEAPESKFKGAVCVDLNPVGPISEYFYFPSGMNSYFLTDSVPESITLQSGIRNN